MLHCLPGINSFHIMVCSYKKHVNVTTNLKSLLYLCLVLSGCVKHKTCGDNMGNPQQNGLKILGIKGSMH